MNDWKDRFCDEVRDYSNDRLFSEYIYSSCGDDYDGGFTKDGEFVFNVLTAELVMRLKQFGFLSSEFNANEL